MFNLDFNAGRGTCMLGGEPVILHCNHYNTILLRTILDPDYIDARPMLMDVAAGTAHAQLSSIFASLQVVGFEPRLKVAADLFQYLGLGRLDFSAITAEGGRVTSSSSHYSFAWKNKLGPAQEPIAFFDAGFVAGALAAAIDADPGYFQARQELCIAMGAAQNQFQVSVEKRTVSPAPGAGVTQKGEIPGISVPSNIDEAKIVSALSSMPIAGNEQGLIPAFGVVLTRMPANYYNGISYGFEKMLGAAIGDENLGASLLVEAGHACAFNTYGGIMESDEWEALVKPMCKTREDWLHGIIAVCNALGWGVLRVHELIPNKRLVVRIYNGYEANAYLATYGHQAKTPKSHLATGGVQGAMNLLYHTDITQRPSLTPELYESVFSSPGSFVAHQTSCRAMGAEFDEFVCERE